MEDFNLVKKKELEDKEIKKQLSSANRKRKKELLDSIEVKFDYKDLTLIIMAYENHLSRLDYNLRFYKSVIPKLIKPDDRDRHKDFYEQTEIEYDYMNKKIKMLKSLKANQEK